MKTTNKNMVLRYFEWNKRGKAGMVSLPKRK